MSSISSPTSKYELYLDTPSTHSRPLPPLIVAADTTGEETTPCLSKEMHAPEGSLLQRDLDFRRSPTSDTLTLIGHGSAQMFGEYDFSSLAKRLVDAKIHLSDIKTIELITCDSGHSQYSGGPGFARAFLPELKLQINKAAGTPHAPLKIKLKILPYQKDGENDYKSLLSILQINNSSLKENNYLYLIFKNEEACNNFVPLYKNLCENVRDEKLSYKDFMLQIDKLFEHDKKLYISKFSGPLSEIRKILMEINLSI